MTILELTNATVIRDGRAVLRDFHWTTQEGEAWAIVGPTGSGKTTLAEALLGRHSLHGGSLHWPLFDRLRAGGIGGPPPRAAGRRIDYISQVVAHVTFKEDSRLFSYAGRYYQQRFEFADSGSDTLLSVVDFLKSGTHATDAERAAVCMRFGIAELQNQPFMTLSNGQTRRARLTRAMLAHPEVLILDDPFIGLDSAARADLSALLGELVRDGKHLVLICREDAVPAWVTNVMRLEEAEKDKNLIPLTPFPEKEGGARKSLTGLCPSPVGGAEGSAGFCPSPPTREGPTLAPPSSSGMGAGGVRSENPSPLAALAAPPLKREGQKTEEDPSPPPGEEQRAAGPLAPPSSSGMGAGGVRSEAIAPISLRDVTVTHSGHTILDRVSWNVRAGERWAVLGPNGSGKSTLLSLLCGDHPQAYSNDVRLFGRQRGSGETIWDVKRNVGLLSPEFHLYFSEPLSAERTAATGFFDTLADRPTSPEQNSRVQELFTAFGISHLAYRAFKRLSTGEQRLVLLARALVKRPPLVILDEPFQGMDAASTTRCREWIENELGEDQTLLFVTHEPSELPHTVTKTLRLQRGRVV